MGRPRNRGIARSVAWSTCLVLLSLAACTAAQPRVSDLLLSPDDFPGIEVTRTAFQVNETADGEPAGQVELSGPGFTIKQSLVLFETEEAALSVLAAIKLDQIGQGIAAPRERGRFEDVSGVLHEARGGDGASSLFFVQRRAFVRITISGPERLRLLFPYAEKARVKAAGR